MSPYSLAWFADEVARLAAVVDAPAKDLPTYGRTEDFARPHIEFDGRLFHFVVVERGQELERKSALDPQEILYEVFQGVMFSMACDYECRHRRRREDARRQMFEVQLGLLGKLSPGWRERRRAEIDETLRDHPFNDSAGA